MIIRHDWTFSYNAAFLGFPDICLSCFLMKLATYKDGSRDGQLVVVSRDLRQAHFTGRIAPRLQVVLDDWPFYAPQLRALYDTLNQGGARHAFPFEARYCMAPLPRAWLRVQDAVMESGASPCLIAVPSHAYGPEDYLSLPAHTALQMQPQLTVISSELAEGSTMAQAQDAIRLFMLAVSWRHADPQQSGSLAAAALSTHLATCYAPVAVTADEFDSPIATLPLQVQTLTAEPTKGARTVAATLAVHPAQLLASLSAYQTIHAGTLLAADYAVSGAPVPGMQMDGTVVGLRINLRTRAGDDVFGTLAPQLQKLPLEPELGI